MSQLRAGVLGLGRLGLPFAVTLAQRCEYVWGFDSNPELCKRRTYEHKEAGPGDGRAFQKCFTWSPLFICESLEDLLDRIDLIFVVVQTPHQPQFDGTKILPEERADFDYTYLKEAVRQITEFVTPEQVVVVVSTVLPGTMRREILPILNGKCPLVYNPAFPAMGTVMTDILNPEFILLGSDDTKALHRVKEFWENFYRTSDSTIPPIKTMSMESAELAKVAYNTAISTKIVLANTLMEICHKTPNCNVDDVTDVLKSSSKRIISSSYLDGGGGDAGPCFPPGQLVMTINGPRDIEAIEPGDMVLSGDGEFHKVQKRWERSYSGELIEVQVRGLPSVLVTPNHLFYAASDLRSQYVTTMRGKIGTRRNGDPVGENLSKVEEVRADELAQDHWIPWPISKLKIPRPEHATEGYCKLLGWYLSDGSLEIDRSTVSGKLRSGRISFHLNKSSKLPFVGKLTDLLLNEFPPKSSGRGKGAKVSIQDRGEDSISIRYGNVELANLFLEDCNKQAETKTLPSWVIFGDRDTARLILDGMYRGDGYLDQRQTNFTTISKDLAYGVFMMLERLGICSNLRSTHPRIGKDGQKHRRSYDVKISNITDVIKLWSFLSFGKTDREQEKTYIRYPIIEGQRFHPIFKTKRVNYSGPVYNLMVAETHNYVVPAGVVSNCHPRDSIAMSWLAKEKHLSFDLFGAMMEAREKQTDWICSLALEKCYQRGLLLCLLGKSYKPETNLMVGSWAYRIASTFNYWEFPVKHFDPYIDSTPIEGFGKAIYLICTKHECFAKWKFPFGSDVIDPFRYIPDQEGVEVIRLGVGK